MTIYQEEHHQFTPAHLYIKQHTVTGKLYFGKTINNPLKYDGSGTHWVRHIKKHGKEHIVTLWYELFTDKDEIQRFALSFSEDMNIVESKQWLNAKMENGLDGFYPGHKHSAETNLKNSNSHKGKKHTNFGKSSGMKGKIATLETKKLMSIAHLGKLHWNYGNITPIETRIKISNILKSKEKIKCPYCPMICDPSNAKQHHFDNCKHKL